MAFGQPSLKTKQFGGEGEMTEKFVSVILQLTEKWILIFGQHALKFTTQAPNVPV